MNKISKITLENFRAFLGKKEIDFHNAGNEPADFICIYGKNGLGKTSLFDGLEWFFTGKIHLLEEGLNRNIQNYNGNILRNNFAPEGEHAGVSIEYSDGAQGCRTVTRKENQGNDYNRGLAEGVYKDVLDPKQILPHSKIDSFVYAVEPWQMYEQWGSFWDPDGSQRDFFDKIYRAFQKAREKEKQAKDALSALLKEQEALEIDRKTRAYNEAVEQFNKNEYEIPDTEPLEPLHYTYNKRIEYGPLLSVEKLLVPLKKQIADYNILKEQCNFLESHFYEYKRLAQRRAEYLDRKKRLGVIIKKCENKKIFYDQQQSLLEQRDGLLKVKERIAGLFDEQWFRDYKDAVHSREETERLEYSNQWKKLKRQDLGQEAELLEKQKKEYAQMRKHWFEQCDAWERQIGELESIEKMLREKMSVTEAKLRETEEKRKSEAEELEYWKEASKRNPEYFITNEPEWRSRKYPETGAMAENLKEKREVYEKRIKEKNEKEVLYENVKTELDNTDKFLTLAREEIQKSNTSTCPVCKCKFPSMEQLLVRIDLSASQGMLLRWKRSLDKITEAAEKAKLEYDDACTEAGAVLLQRIYGQDLIITELNSDYDNYKKVSEILTKQYKEIRAEKDQLKTRIAADTAMDIPELSRKSARRACMEKWREIKLEVEKCDKKMEHYQNEITKLTQSIQENTQALSDISRRKDEFFRTPHNQDRIAVMEQTGIVSYEDYLSMVKENESELEKVSYDLCNLEELLAYSRPVYRTEHIQEYKQLLNQLEMPDEEWADTYEKYKNQVFDHRCIAYKTIAKYKKAVGQKEAAARKKAELLDRCLEHLPLRESIIRYNELEDRRKELQDDRIYAKYEAEVAKEIFSSAKEELEGHIEKTFGGVTIGHIYEKLEPHRRYRKLRYSTGFNDNGRPELYVKVLNDRKEEVAPELFFSSAQLNAVALSIFLGRAVSIASPNLHTLLIDDPIGHFDDLNVLSFVDILRTVISNTDWQIIISTHEENFYEIMKVKLSSRYYNSRFFVFQEEGTVAEDGS